MLRPDRGTTLVFAVSGVIQASWMARLPAIQERLALGVDGLGLALGALGAGTIAGMLVTGRLSARLGSVRVIVVAAAGAAVALVGIAVAPSGSALVWASLAFGVTVGAWDAAMNIRGAAVAQHLGGHLLARFHGFWSVGTVVGAGSGAAAARAGMPVGVQCVAVAGASFALVLLGTRGPVRDAPSDDRQPVTVNRRLVTLAALILAGAFVEGAASDWLAVFLASERGFSHARAATAYAVFVTAMTVGRFATGWLYRYLSPDRLVRAGALVAGAGVVTALLAPVAPAVYAGAALWGLGICFVFPLVLAAGGEEPAPDEVVGALTTIGYGAGLAGPVALGALAGQGQLGTTLPLVLPVLALLVAWLAPSIRPSTPRT